MSFCPLFPEELNQMRDGGVPEQRQPPENIKGTSHKRRLKQKDKYT